MVSLIGLQVLLQVNQVYAIIAPLGSQWQCTGFILTAVVDEPKYSQQNSHVHLPLLGQMAQNEVKPSGHFEASNCMLRFV